MTNRANGRGEYSEYIDRAGRAAFERGKQFIKTSNTRHLVVRKADGTKLVDINLTAAMVIGVFSLFTPIWFALPLIGAAVYLTKLQVEIVREIDENEVVIEVSDD